MLSLEPYSGCSTENCLKVDPCSDKELLRDKRAPWLPSAFRTPTQRRTRSQSMEKLVIVDVFHAINNSVSLHSVNIQLLNVSSYFIAMFSSVININVWNLEQTMTIIMETILSFN